MSQSPISPTYSSGFALQRTAARPVRPSVSRRNSSTTGCTETTCVPLPSDVDPWTFVVRTQAEPADVGIRLANSVPVGADYLRVAVEHADVTINVQKMFPGGKVVVQRGYFPAENVPLSLEVDVKADGASDFTWGDLLSLILRQQCEAAVQGEESVAGAADSGVNGVPSYENVWVVAIRRSDGADGTVRYFPELQVRLPVKQLRDRRGDRP
ncbi:hypothetical protein K466DRAFT_594096 [Polyporus arcularius HHB13444]|uniref:Uncharacterized protein n=1 Tax=Polyporus arcularius HHB13444 TaxID=1314778 RepID=A0A5C3PWF9_9APHY|nr:hypothetical protein K466DRAFT_594096 [Polyporus arcularius HHB13444]